MLEIKFIRKNLSEVQIALSNRGAAADLDTFETADKNRRVLLTEIEELRHQRNVASDQIAVIKKAGKNADPQMAEMRRVADKIKNLEASLADSEKQIQQITMSIPNMPHPSVPIGKNESDNKVIKQIGTPPSFEFEPLPTGPSELILRFWISKGPPK